MILSPETSIFLSIEECLTRSNNILIWTSSHKFSGSPNTFRDLPTLTQLTFSLCYFLKTHHLLSYLLIKHAQLCQIWNKEGTASQTRLRRHTYMCYWSLSNRIGEKKIPGWNHTEHGLLLKISKPSIDETLGRNSGSHSTIMQLSGELKATGLKQLPMQLGHG